MKLNQFIAQNTHLSRSQADLAIKDKRVRVKNKIVTNMAMKINPEKDKIRLDKKLVLNKNIKTYLILNKPKGYTSNTERLPRSTCSDRSIGKHRGPPKSGKKEKTLFKFIPPRKHLKLVDRIDTDTEGLLILSNDGKFINYYNDPKQQHEKEYLATVKGKIDKKESEKLTSALKSFNILKSNTRETLLTLTLNSVRKGQIQKLFDSLRRPVKYLQRIRIGKLKLGTLKKGKSRLLTKEELDV